MTNQELSNNLIPNLINKDHLPQENLRRVDDEAGETVEIGPKPRKPCSELIYQT